MCETDLILAAKNGYYKEVLSLLEQGYSVDIRDKDNATALYWGCCRGYLEVSRSLIEYGCDINARVTWGSTALHASCDRGHIECVKLLINSGANINIQNKRGDTPLHLSSYRGYIEIVKILLQASASKDIKNEKGKTAAEEAHSNGHYNTMVLLTGTDYGVRNISGTSMQLNNKHSRPIVTSFQNMKTHKESPNFVSTEMNQDTHKDPVGGISNHFVRYNSNMSGFCPRTVPQEHTDDVFTDQPLPRRENKLCRHQSLNTYDHGRGYGQFGSSVMKHLTPDQHVFLNNGSNVLLSSHRGQGQNSSDIRPSSSKEVAVVTSSNLQLINSQDYGNYVQMSIQGDICIPPPVSQRPRPNRSSISCPEEISENKQDELEAGFAETLQIQLFKKQEELERKEADMKALTAKLLTSHQHVQQLKKFCIKLQEEKINPKIKNESGHPETEKKCSPESSKDYTYSTSHLGLLSFLKDVSESRGRLWCNSEHLLLALKSKVQSHWLTIQEQSQPLDNPNREWTPGNDFVLMGDKPINHFSEEQRDGSCSLVFQIKHKSYPHILILKMMINLLNMEYSSHGDGYSLDSYLNQHFGPEYDIPCRLKHPNIVSVLHHYDASTERFRKFLSLVVPHKFDVPIEMAGRTTFLVMKKYPETLKSVLVLQRTKYPEPNFGLSSTFIFQLLYQILSAVYHLQRNGMVHRDIKADNILLDENLRPVLTDFGLARRLYGADGKPLKFSDPRQVHAGNAHAWAPELSRLNRSATGDKTISLEEIYSKSDAFAVSRMFYSMLRPISDGDSFPQSSINRPHYEDSDIPDLPLSYPAGLRYILQQLVLDNPIDRLPIRKAMLSVGMLMFPPSSGEITMETETSTYCQAQMLKLLAIDSKQSWKTEECRIEASVKHMMPILEADFLYNITPEEFWEIYTGLRQRQLL